MSSKESGAVPQVKRLPYKTKDRVFEVYSVTEDGVLETDMFTASEHQFLTDHGPSMEIDMANERTYLWCATKQGALDLRKQYLEKGIADARRKIEASTQALNKINQLKFNG